MVGIDGLKILAFLVVQFQRSVAAARSGGMIEGCGSLWLKVAHVIYITYIYQVYPTRYILVSGAWVPAGTHAEPLYIYYYMVYIIIYMCVNNNPTRPDVDFSVVRIDSGFPARESCYPSVTNLFRPAPPCLRWVAAVAD